MMANIKECTSVNNLEQEEINIPTDQSINNKTQKGEGPTSLSGASQEVVETIDTSAYSHPEQKELLIFNLDFEEMAQAMFGKIDVVDQLMAENIDETMQCNPDCIQQSTHLPSFLASSNAMLVNDNNLSSFISHELAEKIDSEIVKHDKKKEKSETNKKSKEDKSIDHVLKSLSHLKTPEEKLIALGKKYVDLTEEHKTVQHSFKLMERKNLQYIKEKEQLQAEHGKAILTKARLESLCRELQRQNKAVKDESLMRVREEEEKRKEVSAKFQTTFNEVTNMMQDSNQKSSKLREENMELAQKLKTLIEQYELREQQVEKIIKHKELEVQLSEAKLAKSNMLLSEEREKLLQEKHQLLTDLTEYQKRCHELTANEVQLRSQLSLYTDKYDEFQGTLNKSNEVFTHFKKEMDKMSKKIKKLESETGTWRTRWENSNKALLEMAAEKQQRDVEYVNITKKLLQLEKLCRALQTERKLLLSQLKGNKETSGENETLQIDGVQDKEETENNFTNVKTENKEIAIPTESETLPSSTSLLNDEIKQQDTSHNSEETLQSESNPTLCTNEETEPATEVQASENLDKIYNEVMSPNGKTDKHPKAKGEPKGKKRNKSGHK